ncbi:hypothetical protein FH063_002364 [Azospirillum argentinense]|uniref:Uncharacterized protein n=1 Tax=Azospirillum argentinense TaxID=2970906 RepID=A0A5B0KMG1_9PROT|nr:hypothetical protein FH063_002364 [Azospirillum argentinense]
MARRPMNQQVLAAQIGAQSHRRVKVGVWHGLYVKSIASSGGTAESVMRVHATHVWTSR